MLGLSIYSFATNMRLNKLAFKDWLVFMTDEIEVSKLDLFNLSINPEAIYDISYQPFYPMFLKSYETETT